MWAEQRAERKGATHRGRRGSGQQRQDASAGHDQVVHHLGHQVDAVVDKHGVLAAVHKVQDRFCGVTKREKGQKSVTTC